jgi:uncharacterized membrane protein YjjP (DUF1212 family)
MEAVRLMMAAATEVVNSHPVTAAVSGIAAAIVAVLQNAQSVASTLIAFVTSIAALITSVLAVRNAWRNRNKPPKE